MTIVGNRYTLIKKVGRGSFGKVYKAKDKLTNNYIALKFEDSQQVQRPQLSYEYRVLKALQKLQSKTLNAGLLFPTDFGNHKQFKFMCMPYVEMSLQQYLDENPTLENEVIGEIAADILSTIKSLHSTGLLHRDIKPSNILLNIQQQQDGTKGHRVYLIDFGLAKKFVGHSHFHIPNTQKTGVTGTLRWCSLWVHMKCESSRRDDVLSWLYTVMFMFLRKLPWMGLKASNRKSKNCKIARLKMNLNEHSECFKPLPSEVKQMMKATHHLGFTDTPPYDILLSLCRELR